MKIASTWAFEKLHWSTFKDFNQHRKISFLNDISLLAIKMDLLQFKTKKIIPTYIQASLQHILMEKPLLYVGQDSKGFFLFQIDGNQINCYSEKKTVWNSEDPFRRKLIAYNFVACRRLFPRCKSFIFSDAAYSPDLSSLGLFCSMQNPHPLAWSAVSMRKEHKFQ